MAAEESVRRPLVRQVYWNKQEDGYDNTIGDGEAGALSTIYRGEPLIVKGDFQRGDQVGRGHDAPDELRVNNGWSLDGSRSQDLDIYSAGWALAFGFGSVSSAGGAAGTTLHTCKPMALLAGNQLPSTSIVERQPDETLYQKFSGVVVNELSISGTKGAWCQLGYGFLGSGTHVIGSAVAQPATTLATPFLFTSISSALGGAGGATEVRSRLTGFNFRWNNALDGQSGYLAGSVNQNGAPVRQKCEIGNRFDACSLELSVEATRAGYAIVTDFLAGTQWAVTLVLRGRLISGSTYEQITLSLPKCYVDDVAPTWDADKKVYTVSLTPHYDTGIAERVSAVVQTLVAQYLGLAA